MHQDLRLQAAPHVVAERDAVAPRQDLGAEALVREALGWIRQHVRGRLEVHEEIARVGGGGVRDFVRVVQGGQPSEPALDGALAGVEGDAERRVEAPAALQLPVRLVDRV